MLTNKYTKAWEAHKMRLLTKNQVINFLETSS